MGAAMAALIAVVEGLLTTAAKPWEARVDTNGKPIKQHLPKQEKM
jgi:hypothetical protein